MISEKFIDIFKALSDATRQDILRMLAEHESCVNEICKKFENMTQPTISHHLQILRRCDLVTVRRHGKLIYYSINRRTLRNSFEEFVASFKIELL